MECDPMTTPEAAGSSSPIPQPVAAPLTRAAIFLVVTINPGADNSAAVRSLCADLAALLRAVGFREPAAPPGDVLFNIRAGGMVFCFDLAAQTVPRPGVRLLRSMKCTVFAIST